MCGNGEKRIKVLATWGKNKEARRRTDVEKSITTISNISLNENIESSVEL
jgi:hypothetical protein